MATLLSKAVGFALFALASPLIWGTLIKSFRSTRGKVNILVFKFFLYELFGITKLRELDLLLLNDKWRKYPLSSFFIPLSFLFDFVYLFTCHKIGNHLVDKV